MNTNDLKIFEAVAESGSFTKAADKMFTVQSNVTARVKSLEEEFDAKLFSRTSRKVELTEAGFVLMRYAKQIKHLVEEAKHEIKSNDTINGHLSIGCMETTMALKAPEILLAFGEKYPAVDLEFKSDNRDVLIADVLNYKLDAAFVSAPLSTNGLEKIKIKEEQLVILTASKEASLNQLVAREPLKSIVFDNGCIFRERLESWFSHKGIHNYKSIELNSIEGIINFVEAGLGISLLPEEVVSKYYPRRKVCTYPLSKQLGTMTTLLVYRKDKTPSKALQCFIDMYLKDVV
ncbi:MAG: LysR family transcriptional regulator [Sphingobacterium sp.]|jgi:DNA-binding transcriptional LysR family regulator|uniref:LysR family transcriptional regulator n=1 Tax=unclassified Sphingobacterium TaxID=2609468 RepID=UPI00284B2DBD|nr:LysR family transcriptional regulator [Sphingobacterium sp.]MDR3010804.1 LysR family transcriptional regulator [Sphingobacterium sp.]